MINERNLIKFNSLIKGKVYKNDQIWYGLVIGFDHSSVIILIPYDIHINI